MHHPSLALEAIPTNAKFALASRQHNRLSLYES